jgi:hypothetical protein
MGGMHGDPIISVCVGGLFASPVACAAYALWGRRVTWLIVLRLLTIETAFLFANALRYAWVMREFL